MRYVILSFLLCLLLVGISTAEYNDSPLTNPEYNWMLQENETIGLPWYGVKPWEVDICTRGLTTAYGYDPASNDVTEFQLSSPIYRDTISITAQKRNDAFSNISYYEVGWYFQPYENQIEVAVIMMNRIGARMVIANSTASPASSFSQYHIYAYPCDPDIHTCPSFVGAPTKLRIEWSTIVGGNRGTLNFIESDFRPVGVTS